MFDRICLKKLLDFPEYILDGITAWSLRKRIIDNCIEEEIWG